MNTGRPRLILFTRHPQPGRVKTRLIPALGAEGAAALHRRLTCRAVRTARVLRDTGAADLEIRFDGADAAAMRHWLGEDMTMRAQGPGDLGERMARAFQESFAEGSPRTVMVGADCPALTPDHLRAAFTALATHPVVFGPATDGGYYLIGLTRFAPELFRGIAWGTDTVLAQSTRAAVAIGLQPFLLEPLDDIDRPGDLHLWRRILADEESAGPDRLAVVIPALNEAAQIRASVASARQEPAAEVIVVDGGSTDDTARLAVEAGATVVRSPPGRARQMNTGAAHATTGTLVFLHADTRLPVGYGSAVNGALADRRVIAGAFRFRVDGDFRGRRLLEWGTNLRARLGQLPYGDQALFLRRAVFEELGGFPDLPILEDYVFARLLRRRGRIALVHPTALTSGRRWERLGFLRALLINQRILLAYHCGVPPDRLARLYATPGPAAATL